MKSFENIFSFSCINSLSVVKLSFLLSAFGVLAVFYGVYFDLAFMAFGFGLLYSVFVLCCLFRFRLAVALLFVVSLFSVLYFCFIGFVYRLFILFRGGV